MKTYILAVVFVGILAFAGGAHAANILPSVKTQLISVIGSAQGQRADVYRFIDGDTSCYVAFYGPNSIPDMECVR